MLGEYAPRTHAQNAADPVKLNVAILIFDGVQIIDYTGPFEVLGSRSRRNVYTVAEKADAVTTNMGMKVIPNYTFENQPAPDILVIPGGGNSTPGPGARAVGVQMDNKRVIDWIRENGKKAKYVMSVCNGAFLLAKAGMLQNLSATTTAGMIEDLAKYSPTTKLVFDKRFVDNGKVITTAGLSSGIDGSLHLIEKLDGIGWAKMIAYGIEYNWQPESDYARAALADAKLPGGIYGVFYKDAQPLDFKGDRVSWTEKWLVKAVPTELQAAVNKAWAAEKGWSKVKTDNAGTVWKTAGTDGKNWEASTGTETVNGETVLTLKVWQVK